MNKKSSRFQKGNKPWNKGKKTGIKPWLGKKRTIKKNRILRRNGYVYISWSLVDEELRKFFRSGTIPVPEHQYIWIKNTNQGIPKGYCIHHINKITDDNRIENLVMLLGSVHIKNHLKTRIDIRCKKCNNLFYPRKDTQKFCSKKCASKSRIMSDETKKKIGKYHKGRIVTIETRKKISDSLKNKTKVSV
jgi:hypothetical protein